MKNEHRVVVTGLGAVSPLGIGARAMWDGAKAGRSAVRRITRFDPDPFTTQIAAEVDGFDPSSYLDRKAVRRTDLFAQYAIAATGLALDDAGYSINGNGGDVGVWVGSALGGVSFGEEQHRVFFERGISAVPPWLAILVFGGSSTCHIGMHFGVHGPNVANGNSCSAAVVAIGDAFRAVARGDVRAAIAGGAEAPLSPMSIGAFSIIRAMSTRNDDPQRASRPFDRERDGFVMAEGAGIVLLERYEDAVARNAPIYGEIAGFGLTGDGYHMAAPDPEGTWAARAMQVALAEAGLGGDEIELVKAHGSSTPLNDKTETLAIRIALGEAAGRVPVMATKGHHGHALGASGAWELILLLQAMRERHVPSIANLQNDDPECDLPLVKTGRAVHARTALANTTGFGGINAALVVREVAG